MKKKDKVVDPTKNVLKLVEESVRRLDDLRLGEIKRIDEKFSMQERHFLELREAEAKRIDAIRAVDVNAVAVASERAAAQATVLANQVAQSADALRTLVANTATTMANQQDQMTKAFNDRLGQLEKAQYENKGRGSVNDPLFDDLLKEVKNLREYRANSVGNQGGQKAMWGYVAGAIGLIIAIMSFLIPYLKTS